MSNSKDIKMLISTLTKGADPDALSKATASAKAKAVSALTLSLDPVYQEAQVALGISKAKTAAKVKRAMRSDLVREQIQAKLEMARQIDNLSEADKVLLGKAPTEEPTSAAETKGQVLGQVQAAAPPA